MAKLEPPHAAPQSRNRLPAPAGPEGAAQGWSRYQPSKRSCTSEGSPPTLSRTPAPHLPTQVLPEEREVRTEPSDSQISACARCLPTQVLRRSACAGETFESSSSTPGRVPSEGGTGDLPCARPAQHGAAASAVLATPHATRPPRRATAKVPNFSWPAPGKPVKYPQFSRVPQ